MSLGVAFSPEAQAHLDDLEDYIAQAPQLRRSPQNATFAGF